MYICVCNAVTDHEIRDAVNAGLVHDWVELQSTLLVGTCCGKCRECAEDCLARCLEAHRAQAHVANAYPV